MPAPHENLIDDLLAAYREKRAAAIRMQEHIAGISATATAPRQAVRVTVGGHGELTGIDFPTHAYRRMAPKELSDAIVAACEQARTEVVGRLAELAAGAALPGGLDPAALFAGRADLAAALPEDPLGFGMPVGGAR